MGEHEDIMGSRELAAVVWIVVTFVDQWIAFRLGRTRIKGLRDGLINSEHGRLTWNLRVLGYPSAPTPFWRGPGPGGTSESPRRHAHTHTRTHTPLSKLGSEGLEGDREHGPCVPRDPLDPSIRRRSRLRDCFQWLPAIPWTWKALRTGKLEPVRDC
jgi:hypothetical protein